VTFLQRIQSLVEVLPDDSSVSFSVATLKAWTKEEGSPPRPADELTPDLTVEDFAELMGKAASTVRMWLNQGMVPEAYKLRGKQWRIPRHALAAFQDRERTRESGNTVPLRRTPRVDLGGWRDEKGARAA
jgi:excisionase family DNA binding protein